MSLPWPRWIPMILLLQLLKESGKEMKVTLRSSRPGEYVPS